MALITVNVQSLLNAALYDSYTLNDTDTVGTLKSTIQTNTGIDPNWYVLSFDNEVLNDVNTLASYSIINGSDLRSGNVIGTLPTLEDRQIAKLDLASLNRSSDNNPYPVYDINLLPSKYVGNVSTPNSHPDGLLEGRPWIIPQPSLFLNPQNYTGSGNTWYDSSGNNYNATLYNSPVFEKTYFTFDKNSFEYASCPNLGNLTTWTIEAWFRISSTLNGQITSVICNEFNLVNKLNFSMGTNNAPGSYNLCVGYFDGAWHSTSGFAPSLGTWYNCIGTYDGTTIKQYVNGTLNTQLAYSGTPQSGGLIRIARRWDSPSNDPVNFFPGDIGLIRIYNSALTDDQVTQNYNQYKSLYQN